MRKIKIQTGITLIALIITIIVLLILAGVAIASIQESDIIKYATDASNKHIIGQEKEQIQLAYNNYKIGKYAPQERPKEQEKLESYFVGKNFTSVLNSDKSTDKYFIVNNYDGSEIIIPRSSDNVVTYDKFIYVYFNHNGYKYKVTLDNDDNLEIKKLELCDKEKSTIQLEVAGAEVIGNEIDGWSIIFNETGNEYTISTNGIIEEVPVEPIIHGGVIPKGAVYKRIAEDGTETQYVAGQAFPETVLDGDIYIFKDYEYRYNYVYDVSIEPPTWMDIQSVNTRLAGVGISLSSGGWGVRVTDITKESYTDMITTINGQDVTNLFGTYTGCTNLVNAPELSNKAKDMAYSFIACSSLTTVSHLPESVTNLAHTFSDCKRLTSVSAIPSGVTNMKRTFACCDLLETAPDMSKATNIANMYGTFEECESLTGEIEINANPSEYRHCFAKTKITKITGTALDSTKEALAKTGTNISWE